MLVSSRVRNEVNLYSPATAFPSCLDASKTGRKRMALCQAGDRVIHREVTWAHNHGQGMFEFPDTVSPREAGG